MMDIQLFFNKAKATYLKDLIGLPVLIATNGTCIRAIKINELLVVDKKHYGHADKISFFTYPLHLLGQKAPI